MGSKIKTRKSMQILQESFFKGDFGKNIISFHNIIFNELNIDMELTKARRILLESSVSLLGFVGTLNMLQELDIPNDIEEYDFISLLCDYKIKTILENFINVNKTVSTSMLLDLVKEKEDLLKLI